MRSVTVSWSTVATVVPGEFTPAGYRVTVVGAQSKDVAGSPAIFEDYQGPAGEVAVSVQVIDTTGTLRGDPATGLVVIPEPTTVVQAPTALIAVAAAG